MRDREPVSHGILPGEVWVIEHDPQTPLSAPDRDILTAANVVLFDRASEPLVLETLPLGGYAEPLSRPGAMLSPRALGLAAEGWSVVQLVAASASRPARLHRLPAGANDAADRPIAAAYAFTGNGLAG